MISMRRLIRISLKLQKKSKKERERRERNSSREICKVDQTEAREINLLQIYFSNELRL